MNVRRRAAGIVFTSFTGSMVAAAFFSGPAATRGQSLVRVSVGTGGVQADGFYSAHPAISADGRHVAFMSRATTLVAGASGYQVYSHDRDPDGNGVFDEGNGVTTLMSRGIDSLPGNGPSGGFNGYYGVSLSETGRYVLWASSSTNLVAGDTTGGPGFDAFVRDRDPDADGVFDESDAYNIRVNVGPGGAQSDHFDSDCQHNALSDDGQLAVFTSAATNMIFPNDPNAAPDVFAHNLASGLNQKISVFSGGAPWPTNQYGHRWGYISGNGRFVAFHTRAPFSASDANGLDDYYIHDHLAVTTVIASVGTGGLNGSAGVVSPVNDYGPALSDDGRFFVFTSLASNLVPGDTNAMADVFLSDRDPDGNGLFDEGTNVTTRVSVDSMGNEADNQSLDAAISGDGAWITFHSWATNLVPGDACCQDIFLYERLTGSVRRVSQTLAGDPANNHSYRSAISHVGRYIAFESLAGNLVPGDTNFITDVFVLDRGPIPAPVVRGDLNCDGAKDGADVAAFALAVLDAATWAMTYPGCNLLNGDFTGDGMTTPVDVPGLVTCLLTGNCP